MKNIRMILSTHNERKGKEIQAILTWPDFTVITLKTAGIKGIAEEDGTTLEENAFKKAWFAHTRAPLFWWAVADDTGLFIKALRGEPGHLAAEWLRKDAPVEETMRYCLKRME